MEKLIPNNCYIRTEPNLIFAVNSHRRYFNLHLLVKLASLVSLFLLVTSNLNAQDLKRKGAEESAKLANSLKNTKTSAQQKANEVFHNINKQKDSLPSGADSTLLIRISLLQSSFDSLRGSRILDSASYGSHKKEMPDLVSKDSLSKQLESNLNRVLEEALTFNIDLPFTKNDLDSNRLLKINKDSLSGKVKTLIKQNSNFGGVVELESFATNFLDPFTPGDKVYTRLYAYPELKIGTIPFKGTIFLTTENNTYYNANSFNMSLDIQQLLLDRQNEYSNKLQEQVDMQQLNELKSIEMDQYGRQLEREVNKGKKVISTLEVTLQDKLATLESQMNRKIQEKGDSNELLNSASKNWSQLESQYLEIEALYNRIQNLKGQINRVEEVRGKVRESEQMFLQFETQSKERVNNLREEYKDKDKVTQVVKEKTASHKIVNRVLGAVDQFDIGICNPFFSNITLSGIPVKGVNYASSNEIVFFHVTAGRTYRDDPILIGINEARPQFERSIGAVKVGLGSPFGNHLYLISMKARDDISEAYKAKDNWVNGIGMRWQLYTLLQTEIELTTSQYHDHFPSKNHEVADLLGVDKRDIGDRMWNNSAFVITNALQLKKKWSFVTKWRQVNPGFRSLGAPYIRHDFAEYDLKLKGKLFRNKLSVTTYYKWLKSNPTKLQETTQMTQGYGFNLRFQSPNWPIAVLSYSPYQQGNNNPDTLYRSNNHLATTTASVIYNRIGKLANTTTVMSYSLSEVEYFQLENQKIKTQFFSLSQTLVSSKHRFELNITSAKTSPGVDTVNHTSIRSNYEFSGNKSVVLGTKIIYSQYKTGAYRRSADLHLRIALSSKIQATIAIENGSLYKLYGFDSIEIITGRLRLIAHF